MEKQRNNSTLQYIIGNVVVIFIPTGLAFVINITFIHVTPKMFKKKMLLQKQFTTLYRSRSQLYSGKTLGVDLTEAEASFTVERHWV